jgi:hypothetical protein
MYIAIWISQNLGICDAMTPAWDRVGSRWNLRLDLPKEAIVDSIQSLLSDGVKPRMDILIGHVSKQNGRWKVGAGLEPGTVIPVR